MITLGREEFIRQLRKAQCHFELFHDPLNGLLQVLKVIKICGRLSH